MTDSPVQKNRRKTGQIPNACGVQPLISIVTPSFNQAQFLEHTIQSVLNQDYPNIEYIIMDGGSTDGSLDIISRYSSHLHYWRSQEDDGQYSAIAEGFRHANGQILAWLNSDDMYVPGAFEKVAAAFSGFPEVHWVSTLKQLLWDAGGACIGKVDIPAFSYEAFLDGTYFCDRGYRFGFIQQESTFWSRSLWERSGGLSTEIGLAADFDLWCRFFRHENLIGLDSELAGFRFHDANRSADQIQYMTEARNSLNELRREQGWTGHDQGFRWRELLCKIPKMRRIMRWPMIPMPDRYHGVNLVCSGVDDQHHWVLKEQAF